MSDSNSAQLREVLTAYGFISVNWALIERQMDNIVSLSLNLGGKEFADERPRMLKPKIKFLKKAFSKLPKLLPYKTRALSLLQDVNENMGLRHDIIHGIIDAVEGNVLRINKINYLGGYDYTVNSTEINLQALPDFATSIAHQATYWIRFANDLRPLLPKHQSSSEQHP